MDFCIFCISFITCESFVELRNDLGVWGVEFVQSRKEIFALKYMNV